MATGSGLLRILKDHQEDVASLTFSPDGKTLVTGSGDCTVKLWDTTTWKAKRTLKHGAEINAVTFSPDGKLLGVADSDSVALWNVASLTRVRTLLGMTGPIVFSPNGRVLATHEVGNFTVRLWTTLTWQLLQVLHGVKVEPIAFSPDSKTLALGSVDKVELRDPATARITHVIPGTWGPSADFPHGFVKALAFSHDGKILATGGESSILQLWDTASWHEIRAFDLRASDEENRANGFPLGEGVGIDVIAFSPDSKLVAAGCADADTRLWEVAPGHPVRKLSGHGEPIESIAFSPDGRLIATGSMDATAMIWGAPTR